jgi:hypothetical protein
VTIAYAGRSPLRNCWIWRVSDWYGRYVDAGDEETVEEASEGDCEVEKCEGTDRSEGEVDVCIPLADDEEDELNRHRMETYTCSWNLGHCRGTLPSQPS